MPLPRHTVTLPAEVVARIHAYRHAEAERTGRMPSFSRALAVLLAEALAARAAPTPAQNPRTTGVR
jgi:hypothetical protein